MSWKPLGARSGPLPGTDEAVILPRNEPGGGWDLVAQATLRLHYARELSEVEVTFEAVVRELVPNTSGCLLVSDPWTLGLIFHRLPAGVGASALLFEQLAPGEEALHVPLAPGTVPSDALDSGEPTGVTSLEEVFLSLDPLRCRAAQAKLGVEHLQLFPLTVDGERLGLALTLAQRQPSTGQQAFMEVAAAHCALALRNVRDRDESQRLIDLDAITWVCNRRRLIQSLETELQRARHYGRTLSVVLLAFPEMRSLGERYGASATNRLLRRLAMKMSNALRAPDLVGRYSPSCFALLLPETDRAGAEAVARRLAEVSATVELADAVGTPIPPLTGTSSIATFPADGDTTRELLAAAEKGVGPAADGS